MSDQEVTRKIENFIPRCGPRRFAVVTHLRRALDSAPSDIADAIRGLLDRIERRKDAA